MEARAQHEDQKAAGQRGHGSRHGIMVGKADGAGNDRSETEQYGRASQPP